VAEAVKFLFVHQNFPGQYLHLVRHLAAEERHEILFLTEQNPNLLPGVRKLVYKTVRAPSEKIHPHLRDLEQALLRAEGVALAARQLKELGFTPDIVIGHHGWGELLDILDVWPDVPLLGYFEFFYHTDGLDVGFDPEFPIDPALYANIRLKNAVNLLALNLPGHGQTPTRFQHETYPPWAREKITIVPEGADLGLCRPAPALRRNILRIGDIVIRPEEKLVTYVARNLEPYRGYHVMVRALSPLLAARRDVRVVLVGGDGVSYGARLASGSWRDYFLNEQKGRFDESRVHLPGKIPYEDYLRLLQRSDAHVYLTYPFVASWSLREALAIGAPVIGSDTEPVREFITDGENGLLTPFHDPQRLAHRILEVLEDTALAERLRAGARRYAEAALDLEDYFIAMRRLIGRLVGDETALAPPAPARPLPARRRAGRR
jgi:glycosyltransferase involved in cell wall biosynthesis